MVFLVAACGSTSENPKLFGGVGGAAGAAGLGAAGWVGTAGAAGAAVDAGEEACTGTESCECVGTPGYRTCGDVCRQTTDDICCGQPGSWVACCASGCGVDVAMVAGYPNYFKNHPGCVGASYCSFHGACSLSCPQPTDADK